MLTQILEDTAHWRNKCREMSDTYEKIFPFTVFLAIPVTFILLLLWQRVQQESFGNSCRACSDATCCLMVGSATLILISENWSKEAKKDLAWVLANFQYFFSFLMYMGE